MPIQLSYNFRARDESEATSFNRMMMDELKGLLPDRLDMDLQLPTPSSRGEDCWDAAATIFSLNGHADPAEESAEARDIADAMGGPWEKSDDGRVRVLAPGTGGFSSSYWQMNWAELRLVAAGDVGAGVAGMNLGAGQRIYHLFSAGVYYLLRSVAYVSLDAGLLLFACQVLYWALGLGWPEIPLFTPFAFLLSPESSLYHWFIEPQSWLGLNRGIIGLLELTPLSLFLLLLGLLLLALQRPRLRPCVYDDS